ncbi:MAG: hypothetical protein Pg6C_10730 [Treponemataceae bacterium]|nr:MAG: hypothetical protein Pg6C_10730 [Treponemataceae bacterium]
MKIKKCITVTLAVALAARVCVSCVVPYADLSIIDFLVATPRREVFPVGYNWNPSDPYEGITVTAVDGHGTSRDIPADEAEVYFPDYSSAAMAFSAEGAKRVMVSYGGKTASFTLVVGDASSGGGGGGGSGGGPVIIITPH